MGNGSSSRRNGRIQHNPHGPPHPPRMVPPPPGYPTSHAPNPGPPLYPSNGHHAPYSYASNYNGTMPTPMGPQFYPHGYMPTSNGQYMMNIPPGFRPVAPNPAPQAHVPPIAESQKTNTIRNHVNLKKATLRLEPDEENPGFHLVAFSFDATTGGSISICFLAKEQDDCSYSPLKPHLYQVRRVPFEKGLVQKFRQAPGSGVNLAMFDERELTKEGERAVYPLVVRTETLGHNPPAEYSLHDEVPIDEPVPRWVHCQATQAVLERKDDGKYKVRVIRQTLWVEGKQYELQEIYGIENSGSASFEDNDDGKDCVICMSEPRDTTALPCRHMCMCSDCAKMLRFQTNRCPICRTPVEKLLEIKVPKTDNFNLFSEVDASTSQSPAYPSVGQSSGNLGEVARTEDITVEKS